METRIQSHAEREAGQQRRTRQRRAFRRNQALGMVLLVLGIVAWWLAHTRPGWAFPAGWWRP